MASQNRVNGTQPKFAECCEQDDCALEYHEYLLDYKVAQASIKP